MDYNGDTGRLHCSTEREVAHTPPKSIMERWTDAGLHLAVTSEGTLHFSFGEFEIDVARHELRCAGECVPIEPQVFDLLVYLVRNRNRVVSKNELIDAVWM